MHYRCSNYSLECAADRPYVRLFSPTGELLLDLFVPASINTNRALDDTTGVGEFTKRTAGHETVFTLEATSSVWRRKTYRIRCTVASLCFETEVDGHGQLTDVHYFGGNYSGQPRWGTGYFWSGTRLSKGFNPEPMVAEEQYFPASSGSLIDATGVPLPGKDGWFFTPPPYCLAFEWSQGWLGFGVEAAPGANRYNDLRYVGQRGAFHLSLGFDGRTGVDGVYRLPDLAIQFGAGPYEVLEAHVKSFKSRALVPDPHARLQALWWCWPIFCGWGSQSHLAAVTGGHAPALATEPNYRTFLATLAEQGISPGVLVIDDKWQATYGENLVDEAKWPDLNGFIAEQHETGRKVLLWLKAWDPEGLPVEECVTNAVGVKVACDPTNPAFERRLRAAVRNMLAADGYDADGFKLDFTARMPSGPGLTLNGDVWGLELMRLYLSILYSEAKAVKPDALVMTHTPHPYLADQLDMIRLNDINKGSDVNAAMRHRAHVARIACPHALIDTDNWPIPDRSSWREYIGLQLELGVPSLYYSSHIDTSGEPLLDEDYELIRRIWGRAPGAAPHSSPLAPFEDEIIPGTQGEDPEAEAVS
ncbi:MAG TPA: hypothetical protein VFD39_07950 [Trueperaceae bacterium]|nr:hypothetical protein [Trueperaceae bacterium]